MVNLFWIHPPKLIDGKLDYSECAQQTIDAHVIKIPVEATQILYNAHHSYPVTPDWKDHAPLTGRGDNGYRATWHTHPISKWVSSSLIHYRHTAAYSLALCKEYTFRYGREHGCEAHIIWLSEHEPAIPHPETNRGITEAGFRVTSDPHLGMPAEYKVTPETYVQGSFQGEVNLDYTFSACAYQSYHNYYLGAKLGLRMATWKKREVPAWCKEVYETKRAEMVEARRKEAEEKKKKKLEKEKKKEKKEKKKEKKKKKGKKEKKSKDKKGRKKPKKEKEKGDEAKTARKRTRSKKEKDQEKEKEVGGEVKREKKKVKKEKEKEKEEEKEEAKKIDVEEDDDLIFVVPKRPRRRSALQARLDKELEELEEKEVNV